MRVRRARRRATRAAHENSRESRRRGTDRADTRPRVRGSDCSKLTAPFSHRYLACERFLKVIESRARRMPTDIQNPNSIVARKPGQVPGEQAEKGLITLPGEQDRELEDLAGSTYLTTKVDTMVNWARGNSLWPLPFGTACCAIEFMSLVSSHYDLARIGAEVVRFSPRQAD